MEKCAHCGQELTDENRERHRPKFGHEDWQHDTDPSRQRQPVKRASALSTASASASTLSTMGRLILQRPRGGASAAQRWRRKMKKMILTAALAAAALAQPALADGLYLGAGGAASDGSGGMSALVGLRAGHLAAEGTYASERMRRDETVTQADGALDKRSTSWHGIGAAALAHLPLRGELGLVLRAGRERLRSGDEERWRTSIGAGVQYGGDRGSGVRAMLEKSGDYARMSAHLVYGF